jgi:hypothetical protein
MRKLILAAAVAAMSLGTIGAAVADDEGYVADPPGDNGRCQEVGDPRAGDNDDNGLAVADLATDVIRTITGDDECDNSGGRRG